MIAAKLGASAHSTSYSVMPAFLFWFGLCHDRAPDLDPLLTLAPVALSQPSGAASGSATYKIVVKAQPARKRNVTIPLIRREPTALFTEYGMP